MISDFTGIFIDPDMLWRIFIVLEWPGTFILLQPSRRHSHHQDRCAEGACSHQTHLPPSEDCNLSNAKIPTSNVWNLTLHSSSALSVSTYTAANHTELTWSTFILKIKLKIAEHGVYLYLKRTWVGGWGLDSSGQDSPMANSYGHGNECSGSIKGMEHVE